MSGRDQAESQLSLFSSGDEEEESSSDVRRNPRSPVRRLTSTASQTGTEHDYGTISEEVHVPRQLGFTSEEDICIRSPSESGRSAVWCFPIEGFDRCEAIGWTALFGVLASTASYLIYKEFTGESTYRSRMIVTFCLTIIIIIACVGGVCFSIRLSRIQKRRVRRRRQRERLSSSARIAGTARPSAMRVSRDPMPSTSRVSRPDVPVDVESLQTGPTSHELPTEYIELTISSPTSRAIADQYLREDFSGLARDPVSSRSGTRETALFDIPSAKGEGVPPTTGGQGEERASFRVPRLSSSQETISSVTLHSEDSPRILTRAAHARAQLEQMGPPTSPTTPQRRVQPDARKKSQSETDVSTQGQTTPVRRSDRIAKKIQ